MSRVHAYLHALSGDACLEIVLSRHEPIADKHLNACMHDCIIYPASAHEPAVHQANSSCGMFSWGNALQHAKNGLQASPASLLGEPLRQASWARLLSKPHGQPQA